jgi:UDP-N-acetylmuramoyl-L-alanyl-D-glutamate--2,6-diaminopimelate ligase
MSAPTPTLRQLLAGYGIEAPPLAIAGLGLSAQALAPGEVFLAVRGSRAHGLMHAAQAVAQGAAAVLYEPEPGLVLPELPVPLIAMPELRGFAGVLADHFDGQPSAALKLIGVTGTNGKTSVVQLIGQALARLGYAVATQGTLGAGPVGALVPGSRTTPDAPTTQRWLAEMRDAGITHVAMEVSSHALDQHRVAGLRFHTAVYTNLSHDHLDYHGSMEAYFQAKSRLFRWPDLKVAAVNQDDAWGRRLAPKAAALLSYGFTHEAAIRGSGLTLLPDGLQFKVDTPWGTLPVDSRLLGAFNAANLLAVIAALLGIGVPLKELRDLLPTLSPVHGRMNRLGGGHLPLVVVDYAHTPDALEQALYSLRAHVPGRLVVVFGCGGDRDRAKRPLMGAIARRLADRVVLTDDNPRSEDGDAIVAEILAGIADPQTLDVERDRARAIRMAVLEASPGDLVLIAGKGHECTQETQGVLQPFDDTAVAQAALVLWGRDAGAVLDGVAA